MASRIDYKKKLIDYRKSIGTYTPKTVAFKEPTPHQDDDTQSYSSQNRQTLEAQQHHQEQLRQQISNSAGYSLRNELNQTRPKIGNSVATGNFLSRDELSAAAEQREQRCQYVPNTAGFSIRNDTNQTRQKFANSATVITNSNYLSRKELSKADEQQEQRRLHVYSAVGSSLRDEQNQTRPKIANSATAGNFYFRDDLSSSPEPSLHQLRYRKLASQEGETLDENSRSVSRESSILKITSPHFQKEVLPTPGFLREKSSLSQPIGRYVNWNSHHALLASQPWCCIGDLMSFCDKYEFKAISVSDVQTHANIVTEVRSLLNGKAPFDMRRRFPSNIRNEGNLMVCIGRCPSIEYHLERILTAFRRPMNKLSTDKQNIAKQNFHLTIRQLHLDISGRISEIRLYDRMVFEKEFHLKWQDTLQ